jgi:hypothetical protein
MTKTDRIRALLIFYQMAFVVIMGISAFCGDGVGEKL